MTKRVAAVVLAAGASTRLGKPKQLVPYKGMPLVARAARAALHSGTDPIVVVLGANAEAVGAALSGIPVVPVINPEWNRGIGTSIATGVKAILGQAPSVDAVLVMLGDQPLVDGPELRRLLEGWPGSDASVAAAAYADTIGVPAVFGRGHFDALCSLQPLSGAARLLREANARPHRVTMPEGATDIDTPNDLERLRDGAAGRQATNRELL
jgi:molybdenum cofactor cytidylyltransferase